MYLRALMTRIKILRSRDAQCNTEESPYRDKTEVPDPLAVEDLTNYKLNNRQILARLVTQYRNIFSNISKGTGLLLQSVTKNDSSFKRYKFKIWEIRYNK